MSTTTRSAPTFRSAIVLDPGAATAIRAGDTESATGGRPAPTPSGKEAGAKTIAVTAAVASAAVTAQSR
jgi:hypothetical protein